MEAEDITTGPNHRHILIVSYCAQGHINPSLQLAKRLTRHHFHVTFLTTLSAYRRMSQIPSLPHISFTSIFDDGLKPNDDRNHYLSEIKRRGSDTMKEIVKTHVEQGQPFAGVVYTLLFPWVAMVARLFQFPSFLLWIQSATVFALYYYYNNGYQQTFETIFNDTSKTIQLLGLPLLTPHDVPSFFHSSNIYDFVLPAFRKLFELLLLHDDDHQEIPTILVNTFEELEHDAVRTMNKFFHLLPVGSLTPSAFLDGQDPSDVSYGGDMFQRSSKKNEDYIDWLNSKPEASVVYVSFGSISTLSKQQNEEIARALLSLQRPFLWVVRDVVVGDEITLSCKEELEHEGRIGSWSSQLEVLSSPATGCFLTHCGWNSSLESLVCGVPMVVFPQWSDQTTNAKIVQDMSKTGMRLEVADDREGVVKGEEIKRCLELVMGDSEKGKEIKRNAMKWKKLAKKAASEGGSSHANFKAFVDQICS